LKDVVVLRKFESDDDDVVIAVRAWLRQKDKESYQSGIQTLVPRWHKAVELHGEFVEN
jgi:hypothetical protein